jgi:hypothetical protein
MHPTADTTLVKVGNGSGRRVMPGVRPLREANPVSDSNVVIFVTKTGRAVLIEQRVFLIKIKSR